MAAALARHQPFEGFQGTALIHIEQDAGHGPLLVGKAAVQNGLQRGQFGFALVIEDVAVRQFSQFIITLGLGFGQFAFLRIDAIQLALLDLVIADIADPPPGGGDQRDQLPRCGSGRISTSGRPASAQASTPPGNQPRLT